MNSFNTNPFDNNQNQTKIVSNYNKLSKSGGRVSLEEIKKNMQKLKQNKERITIVPNQQNSNQNYPNFYSKNQVSQNKIVKDRINDFRNIGRN